MNTTEKHNLDSSLLLSLSPFHGLTIAACVTVISYWRRCELDSSESFN